VEDDGCGTVYSGGLCAQFLTDFACAINCNPNLYVNGINYNTANYGLPSMVRIWGGKGMVKLSASWMAYVSKINPSRAQNYMFAEPGVFKKSVGWSNAGGQVVEQLTFSGNVVNVWDIDTAPDGTERAYIESFYNDDKPPASVILPFENSLNPLIQLFSTQYTKHLDMSTDGRYPRTLIIANPEESLWMNLRDLTRL